jgi:hypothetical protein
MYHSSLSMSRKDVPRGKYSVGFSPGIHNHVAKDVILCTGRGARQGILFCGGNKNELPDM